MSSIAARELMPEEHYGPDAIEVLPGLELVRRRPGMFIGDTRDGSGLHHMVHEVVHNVIDEALAGYCGRMIVTLNADCSVTVEDNGCGIPTEIHPREGVPAVELIMTRLQAGGRFERRGAGIAVVNALSSRLDLTIWRAGNEYAMSFEDGVPKEPLKVVGDAPGRTGTRVTFLPSKEIFTKTEFNAETLKHWLRERAFLCAGLHMTLMDLRGTEPKSEEIHYAGGLKDFVRYLDRSRTPIMHEPIAANAESDGIGVEAAFWWNSGVESDLHCYANHTRQGEGGAHSTGLLAALTQAVGDYAAQSGIAKSIPSIIDDDVLKGFTGVISVAMDWPHYYGATSEELASPEVHPVVQNAVAQALGAWFEAHPRHAKVIVQKIVATVRKREAGEHLARALKNTVNE